MKLAGDFKAWDLTIKSPLTPIPIRVQIADSQLVGYSETTIGWAPLQHLSRNGSETRFAGTAGIVEGMFRLVTKGDAISGTFSMEEPFAGTFEVLGRSCEASRTISLVFDAVDTMAPYSGVLREPAPLAGYTLYRPNDNEQHPVVVWGNGGGSLSNEGAQTFLSQVAAAGYVIVAPGPPSNRAAAVMNDARPEVLIRAIEWAASGAAPFLDRTAIGVMGHSMGGVQSWAAASHPAVSSLACWNGSSGAAKHVPSVVERVRVPTLIVTGGSTDGAAAPSKMDFALASNHLPTVLIANEAAGHSGLFHGINDPEAVLAGVPRMSQELEVIASVLAVRWLNFTLRQEAASASYFLGDASVIDGLAGWSVQGQSKFNELLSP